MNLAGFEKVVSDYALDYAPYVLGAGFGLLLFALLLQCSARKGRLPHLAFFLILLVMGGVIFLGREDKAVWIPAAITMLGVAAPAALAWKSFAAAPDTTVPFDPNRMAEQLYAQLTTKDQQLGARDEQIKALTGTIQALTKADAPVKDINAALLALEQGDTREAKAVFAQVLQTKEAEGRKADKEAAAAFRHLGALAYMNNPLEALVYYQKAVQLDPDNADGWNRLGALLYRTGELGQAKEAYHKALALAEAQQEKEKQAWALGNLGLVYDTRRELDKAEEMYRKGLEISEALGLKETSAWQYGNLGLVYYTRGELDKAEEMYRKSLEISEALGLKETSAWQYGNLGNVYQTRGDLNKAEEMHGKALELDEALGRKQGMAIRYSHLSNVYGRRGELDKAEEMYRKALELNEALGLKETVAAMYSYLGLLYEQRGNLAQAEEAWRKSLCLYQEMGAMQHRGAKIVQRKLDELAQKRGTSPR